MQPEVPEQKVLRMQLEASARKNERPRPSVPNFEKSGENEVDK